MQKTVKFLIYAALAGIAAAAGGLFWATSPQELSPLGAAPQFDPSDIERGEMLAMIGDCSACHTAPGGADYAGGFGLPTPFGTIYSTNITPDPQTGIGAWSFEAFDRAMRQGIDRQGRHLYPAFPYDYFAKTTEPDMRALYAYFMTREPVVAADKENELPFPFSFRPMLAGWKLLFLDSAPFSPDPALDDEENHGAYLAASLGHCGACHTPRNLLGAVVRSQRFQGGIAEGWDAPPLGVHSIAPVAWQLDDYADYLFDGWSESHGIAGGPMTAVADHLYEADEDDVFAIAAWLAAITPQQDKEERKSLIAAAGQLDWPNGTVFDEELPTDELKQGQNLFAANCSKCHKQRLARSQPVSLALSYAVNAPSPQNLFNVVRQGIQPPQGSASRKMAAVTLSDEELALVAGYVRWHFSDAPAWNDLPELAKSHRLTMDKTKH